MTQVIDERVVEMRFDNKDFEKNVAQSMSTLDKLKAALNFDSIKPLENLSKNMGKLDVSGVADAVEEVNNKFSVMEIAGVTAVAKITSAAMDAGVNIVKSLSLDQISTGFDKYAQKTTAIQTIISATGESIEEVTKQIDKLNWFTDETSYNLTDMIDNIAKFTNSGISLADAVPQMMGIAAAAGDAGKGVQGATHAMEGLSKAMAVGYMSKQNWKWIETSGIDTERFRRSMIEAAEECGTLTKVADNMWETLSGKAVTAETISENLKEKWMTAEVMQRGLSQFGEFSYRLADVMDYLGGSVTTSRFLDMIDEYREGTLDLASAAEECEVSVEDLQNIMEDLANDEMELGNHALKMSQEAKTFAEAISSVKDAVSTGWMTTIEYLFGNYEQAKVLWTGLANDLWEVFAGPGAVRNEILGFWSELGGRAELIKGLISAVNLLVRPLSMVKQAFDSMFPETDKMGMILYNLTVRFHNFMEELQPSEETMNDLYWVFKGLFSILKTGLSIINNLIRIIIPINKPIRGLLDIVVKLLGFIGKGLYIISELISRIHILPSALEAVRSILSGIGEFLKTIAGGALTGLLTIITLIANGFAILIQNIAEFIDKTRPLEKLGNALTIIFGALVKVLVTAASVLAGIIAGPIALAVIGFNKLTSIISKFMDEVKPLDKAGGFFTSMFNKMTGGAEISSKKLEKIINDIKKYPEAIKNAITSAYVAVKNGSLKPIEGVGQAFTSIANVFKSNAVKIITDTITKLEKVITRISAHNGAPAKLVTMGAKLNTVLEKIKKTLNSTTTSYVNEEGQIVKVTTVTKNAEKSYSGLNTVVAETGTLTREVTEEVKESKTAWQKLLDVLKKVASAFTTAGGFILALVVKLGTAVVNFFTKVINLGKRIINGTVSIKDIFGKLSNFVHEKISLLGEKIKEILAYFGVDFETVKDRIETVTKSLSDFLHGLDSGKIAAIAFAASMIGIAGALIKISGSLDAVLSGVSSFFSNINAIFKKQFLKSTPMTDFANGFAIIAASLTALAFVDKQYHTNLVNAAKIMKDFALISLVYSAAMASLAAFMGSEELGKKFETNAKLITVLAGSLLVLSAAMAVLSKIDITGGKSYGQALVDWIGKMIILLAMLGEMAVAAWAFQKVAPKLELSIWSFVGLAAAFAIIAHSLKELEHIEIGNVQDNIWQIGTILAAFGVVLVGVGKLKPTSALSILFLAKSLQLIVPALKQICNLIAEEPFASLLTKVKNNVEATIALSTLLAGLGIALYGLGSLSKFFLSIGAAATVMMLGVGILVKSLRSMTDMLKDVDSERLNQAKNILISFVRTIGGVFATLLVLDSTINLIGFALSDKDKKYEQASQKFASMGIAMLALAASMHIMVAALGKLAELSKDYSKWDLTFLSNILNGMMLVFGATIAAAGYAARGKHAMGVIISTLIGLGAMVAAVAAIATMVKYDPYYVAIGFAGLGAIVLMLEKLFEACAKISDDAGKGLTRLATSIAIISLVYGAIAILVGKASPEQLGIAAAIIGGILVALAGLPALIRLITNKIPTNEEAVQNTVKSLTTVIIGLVAICAALYTLTAATDSTDLRKTAAILGVLSAVVMVGFTALLHTIAKIDTKGGYKKTIVSFVAIVSATIALAIELGLLATKTNPGNLTRAAVILGSLSGVMVGFTALLVLLAKGAEKVKIRGIASVLLMFSAVAIATCAFAKELIELAKFPVERIQQSAITLGLLTLAVTALTGVVAAIATATGAKGLLGAVTSLMIMATAAGSVYFIAEALSKLADFDPATLQKASDVIWQLTAIMTGITALIAVVAAVATIATGGIAFVAIVGALVLLAVQCAIIANFANSIYVASEALERLVAALKEFQNLNFTTIANGFSTLASAATSITTFSNSLVTLGPNLATFEKLIEDLKTMEGLQGTGDTYFEGFSENGEKMETTVVKMEKSYEELVTNVQGGTIELEKSNDKIASSTEKMGTRIDRTVAAIKSAYNTIKDTLSGKNGPIFKGDANGLNVDVNSNDSSLFKWKHPIMTSILSTFTDSDVQSQVGSAAKTFGDLIGVNIADGIASSLGKLCPAILSNIQSLFGGVLSFDLSNFYVYTPNANWDSHMIEKSGFPAVKKAAEEATIPMANYGKEVNNASSAQEAMSKTGRATRDQIMALNANTAAAGEAMKKTTDITGGLKKQFGGLGDKVQSVGADFNNYLSDGLKKGAETAKEATDAIGGVGGAMEEAGKKGSKGAKGVKEFMESLQDTLEGQMDIFSKFETKTETSAKQMLENMKSNIDGFASWSHRMSVLAIRGLDQGLLEKLAELGPKGYDTMNAFYTMTDDQLKEANELFQTSLAMPEAAAQVVGDSYAYCGEMATQGWSDALNKHIGDHVAIHGWADDQLKAFKDKLKISSPSQVFTDFGKYCIEGFRLGLIDQATVTFLRDTINLVCKWDIVEVFKTNLSSEVFEGIAKDCLGGLKSGLTDEQLLSDIKKAAEEVSELIPEKAASALKINSPSKVMMEIGSSVGEGLALGIRDSAQNVRDATNMVVDDAMGEDSMFGRLQEVIDAGLDLNPVITPMLDLSYMRSQMNELNDMMASPAYAPTDGQNEGTTGNGSINFTQNNYSPKALSRIEIYRQTKNQINMLSGVMANA